MTQQTLTTFTHGQTTITCLPGNVHTIRAQLDKINAAKPRKFRLTDASAAKGRKFPRAGMRRSPGSTYDTTTVMGYIRAYEVMNCLRMTTSADYAPMFDPLAPWWPDGVNTETIDLVIYEDMPE
jgi:hypothetical protein